VGTAQFGTHCTPNWEGLKECTHVPEVALVKSFPEIHRKPFAPTRQQQRFPPIQSFPCLSAKNPAVAHLATVEPSGISG